MTAALVVHTMQVGLAAVLMTARAGAAAALAAHDLGLARIALQGAVGVADVTWATSVANAQSAYDALMGRGQVAAAERLRDPFVEYKATQAQIGGDLRTKLAVNDVERKIAAEQHATSSGGFNGDWSKTFTYVIGGLQMVGGAVEVAVGAKLLVAAAASGATGVGIPIAIMSGTLGAFMVGHGLDTANTGFQMIVTGAPQRTLTSQKIASITGVSRRPKPASDRRAISGHLPGAFRPTGHPTALPPKESCDGECDEDGDYRGDSIVTIGRTILPCDRTTTWDPS